MARNRHFDFNRLAPDLVLLDTAEQPVRLSDLWAKQPLLLAFTRHFGCTQCKEMLDKLVAAREQIEGAGLRIVIVLMGTAEASAAFARQFAPGLLCLTDPERKAYAAYGLERGSLFQTFLNWRVWTAVAKSRKKGYRVEPPPPGQDAMQMSGIFIINTEGHIVLPYYFDNIADHPPLDLLLSGVLYTRWNQKFSGHLGPESRHS